MIFICVKLIKTDKNWMNFNGNIGSPGKEYDEEVMQNVTVESITFINTQNGARIKSWVWPSKGFVKGLLFQDGTIIIVQNPIVIDQNYCPDDIKCPGQVMQC